MTHESDSDFEDDQQAQWNHDRRFSARSSHEALAKWDAGESVWSVEMGGLGPGYEQALQIFAFEVLREYLDRKPQWPAASAGDDVDDETGERMQREARAIADAALERCGHLGLSGAQYGAASSLAAAFYRQGYQEALDSVDQDRRIQVSKNFPSG